MFCCMYIWHCVCIYTSLPAPLPARAYEYVWPANPHKIFHVGSQVKRICMYARAGRGPGNEAICTHPLPLHMTFAWWSCWPRQISLLHCNPLVWVLASIRFPLHCYSYVGLYLSHDNHMTACSRCRSGCWVHVSFPVHTMSLHTFLNNKHSEKLKVMVKRWENNNSAMHKNVECIVLYIVIHEVVGVAWGDHVLARSNSME